ncbi:MAG: hypothetical protein ATN31_08505 [Candidatus Epulonipiscioides saccharophilum]|nr:MAG: hypothetical protein ATN31_08505 [Epulopiscium sp. AS2M-Bin001]
MKKNMFVISLTLAVATTLLAQTSDWIEVDGIEGGKIKFDYSTGMIIDSEDYITAAYIPEMINSVKVQGIGREAFHNINDLLILAMPDSITYIGQEAFGSCDGLSVIALSNNLEEIDNLAFSSCDEIQNLDLPANIDRIGMGAFYDCEAIRRLTIPGTIKEIDKAAFQTCDRLYQVTFLPGIESIGSTSFIDCDSLQIINMPLSFTEINMDSFKGSNHISRINYEGSEEQLGFLDLELPKELFTYCNDIRALDDWIEVEGIEGGRIQFDSNSGEIIGSEKTITIANIPSFINEVEVISIANNAFANCEDLLEITIPDTVYTIKDFAFFSCDNLRTEVVIPKNVETVSQGAFGYNPNLETIFIHEDTKIDDKALVHTEAEEIIYSENYNEDNSGYWHENKFKFDEKTGIITDVKDARYEVIPEQINGVSVIGIGNGAFKNATDLRSIKFPKTLKYIGDEAFSGCEHLYKIDLPANLVSIGDLAFRDCTELMEVNFEGGLEEIGVAAFFNCSMLEEIRFNDGLEKISDLAFYGCRNIEVITIPETIKDIGSSVFKNCDSLLKIYFGGSKSEWDDLDVSIPDGIYIL